MIVFVDGEASHEKLVWSVPSRVLENLVCEIESDSVDAKRCEVIRVRSQMNVLGDLIAACGFF